MARRGTFEELGTLNPRGIGKRRVRAYVPANAGTDVLFMFDGQNVFHDEGSFAGGWHVHEVVEKHAQVRRTLAPIVVAIDHGGVARIDELAPFRHAKLGGGKLPALIDTLLSTVVPRVDARFGVASRRFIGGSSLGGLAAIYAHLVHPSVFAGAMAMSPSLWFTRARLAALLHGQPRPERSRIYLDCGGREGASMWPAIEAFANRLQRRGWRDEGEHRLLLHFAERGKHDEEAWRKRFPRALRFLLAR